MEYGSDLMNPNVTPELRAEAEAACRVIEQRFQDLFPGRQCRARVRNVIGDYIEVRANMLKIGEKPAFGIDLNAPAYMTFMINMSDDFGQPLNAGGDFDVNGQGPQGVKFRKLRASSPTEGALKLTSWFQRNAESIRAFAK